MQETHPDHDKVSLKRSTFFNSLLDEPIELHGRYYKDGYGQRDWNVKATWSEIFAHISPYMEKYPNDAHVKSVLQSALLKKLTYSAEVLRT